jgi:hypothetical protein
MSYSLNLKPGLPLIHDEEASTYVNFKGFVNGLSLYCKLRVVCGKVLCMCVV